MAPALSRLKRRAEFVRVTRHGRKAASAGLVLQAAPLESSDHDGGFRVGFTVTRWVGNAVVRNRVRRRLRAVAEEIMPSSARAGFDYVLVGRAATKDRPYDALRRDLVSALERLNLREKAGGTAAPARGKVT